MSVLRSYNITRVIGDRYAGEWPREQFRKRGIQYEVSELSKSQIYSAALAMLNSRSLTLLDHPRSALADQPTRKANRTRREGHDQPRAGRARRRRKRGPRRAAARDESFIGRPSGHRHCCGDDSEEGRKVKASEKLGIMLATLAKAPGPRGFPGFSWSANAAMASLVTMTRTFDAAVEKVMVDPIPPRRAGPSVAASFAPNSRPRSRSGSATTSTSWTRRSPPRSRLQHGLRSRRMLPRKWSKTSSASIPCTARCST